eukprot:6575174-Pyramimonas_sp.AAC.1
MKLKKGAKLQRLDRPVLTKSRVADTKSAGPHPFRATAGGRKERRGTPASQARVVSSGTPSRAPGPSGLPRPRSPIPAT